MQFRPFDAGAYSRAGYYRHWQARAPCREETDLQDAIQRLALANRRYGYRRITALLGREGRPVNHKRVLRLMREDNQLYLRVRPFVPRTTDSRHGWRAVPNLARGMKPTGCDQFWVAAAAHAAVLTGCLREAAGGGGRCGGWAGEACRGSLGAPSRKVCRGVIGSSSRSARKMTLRPSATTLRARAPVPHSTCSSISGTGSLGLRTSRSGTGSALSSGPGIGCAS